MGDSIVVRLRDIDPEYVRIHHPGSGRTGVAAAEISHLRSRHRLTIRDQVAEFHRAFGQPILDRPQVPSEERVRLRLRLIAEEFFELLEASISGMPVSLPEARRLVDSVIERGDVTVDLPALVDALVDMRYVEEGMFLEFGVDSGPACAEVHRANLSKLGADGKPILRPDGKVVKPDGWTPPDIEGVLRAQGWTPPSEAV